VRKARAAVPSREVAPTAASAECLAPLYGVVHLQPAPGEPPFVQPGQAVEAGQLLCVIEAMKMFNEVRADHAATVQAVLVHSGQEVEAGQPLFRFE
jgi:acetyl-CoA carboxylase biotin carboxyl carrier protein